MEELVREANESRNDQEPKLVAGFRKAMESETMPRSAPLNHSWTFTARKSKPEPETASSGVGFEGSCHVRTREKVLSADTSVKVKLSKPSARDCEGARSRTAARAKQGTNNNLRIEIEFSPKPVLFPAADTNHQKENGKVVERKEQSSNHRFKGL